MAMTRNARISAETDLKPFFKEMIEVAVHNQNLDITPMSQFYLVSLLDRFARTKNFFDWDGDHFEEVPLAIRLTKALKATPLTRIKELKRLGDVSLYTSGFFGAHIDRQLVDRDYYISMGESAYKSLSGIFTRERTFADLYEELAFHFVGLIDVLIEVRESGGVATNIDLIRLYEQWLKTRDPRIKERLEREGIPTAIIDPSSENH